MSTEVSTNVLCLVLAHKHPIIDQWVNVWRQRKSHPNVSVYFLYADPDLESEFKTVGDEIWVKGEESIIPGILHKTLQGMSWAVSDDCPVSWNWLLRSNISSLWNWDIYVKQLSGVKSHGSILGSLQHWTGTPTDDLYNYFVSGCGLTCSRNLIEFAVSNKDYILSGSIPARSHYDDVIISQFFFTKLVDQYHIFNYKLEYCSSDEYIVDKNAFHFRVYSEKGDDRLADLERYSKLSQIIDGLSN